MRGWFYLLMAVLLTIWGEQEVVANGVVETWRRRWSPAKSQFVDRRAVHPSAWARTMLGAKMAMKSW